MLPASPIQPEPLPGGYSLRPAALTDLVVVLRLCVAQNQADYQVDGVTATGLLAQWRAPNFHAGYDHWLLLGPDRQALAYGEFTGEGSSFQLTLAADQGLWAGEEEGFRAARRLVERIEQRMAELSGGEEARLGCRLGERNEPLCRLVEACGFRRSMTFHIMEVELGHPPVVPVLPPGVRIRAFRSGEDDQAVYRADEEASEDKGYHKPLSYEGWCERMGRHGKLFDPSLWFLAFAGGELAGAALNFYEPSSATAWVDHLGVRRAFRQRGIGMALLAHSLNAFYERGYTLARLSVDSHSLTHAPRLYERAGFRSVVGYHIYRKP